MPVLTLDQLEQLRDIERLETLAPVDIVDYIEEPIEAGLLDLAMDTDTQLEIVGYKLKDIIKDLNDITITYITEEN